MYLTDLFKPYNYNDLFFPSTLEANPALVHFLLRHIECGILIKMLNGNLFSTIGLDADGLFHLLAQISENDSINPEYRARAMAMRIVRTFGWESGQVYPCWASSEDEKSSPMTLQLKLIREIETAMQLHKNYSTENSQLLHLTLSLVKRAMGHPFLESYKAAMNVHKGGINPNDLLATFIFVNLTMRIAIAESKSAVIGAVIQATDELKLRGEWGMLFRDWWRIQEIEFAKRDIWRKEWELLKHRKWQPLDSLFTRFHHLKFDP